MSLQTDYIQLTYQLQFESPFHCGTGLSSGLIQRTVAREKEEYLYIPGSTLKGVLRETCEEIALMFGLAVRDPHDEQAAMDTFKEDPAIVELIFGSRYRESTLSFGPGQMIKEWREYFDPEHQKKKYMHLQVETRTQTSLSRQTGTVREGSLYTSEFGIRGLAFEGAIGGYLEGISHTIPELPGTYSLILLIAGLYGIERLGANRSIGSGQCKCTVTSLRVSEHKNLDPDDYLTHLEDLEYYTIAMEEG